jgi:hypothetical protein
MRRAFQIRVTVDVTVDEERWRELMSPPLASPEVLGEFSAEYLFRAEVAGWIESLVEESALTEAEALYVREVRAVQP